MKKFILIFLIFIYFGKSFSYVNQDYTLFLTGKKAYYKKNYTVAKLNFETLLKTFPSSAILSNNYAYFFIGMNYYKLGDYKNAAYYLEKAVYISSSLLNDNYETEKLHIFAERDFSLGDSFLKIGDKNKAMIYLHRVSSDVYYPFVARYEKKALEILKDFSSTYKAKLELKFEYNFDMIDEFYTTDLLKIAKFYVSRKEYIKADEFYSLLLSKKNLSIEEKELIYKDYFELLIEKKDYKKVLDLTQNYNKEFKDMFKYYRGIAFYKKRDFSRALFLFNSVKDGEFYSKANYYSAGIYFAIEDYKSSLDNLKNVKEKNIIVDSMMAFCYIYIGDQKASFSAAKNIVQKYPNTYSSLYFKKYLESGKISINNLNSLENLMNFSDLILKDQKFLPRDFIPKADSLEIKQLSDIANLKDRDILRVAFIKSSFAKKNTTEATLATTLVLENGNFYELAFKNSFKSLNNFSEYNNLIGYNFPLYYKDIIQECSKTYDVPQELIYTIIHTISEFNPYYISKDSKFGIMNISYNENSSLDFFELFDVKNNIQEGTKILKDLLTKYEGSKIKTLIAYVYGEEYVNLLFFGDNNDINLSSIVIPEERFFLQNMFITYIFYLKLYSF